MPMALSAKLAIGAVVLAVAAGLTTVIVLVVNNGDDNGPDFPPPGQTTPIPVSTTEESDLPYRVGVGIADMTGPCVDITFVSIEA